MIKSCPSTLKPGFSSYTPVASRSLFGSPNVSPILDFTFEDLNHDNSADTTIVGKISVSGVQEKYPALVEEGKIRLASAAERSTHILKPIPWNKSLRDRQQIPANEHLTMQIASQVYAIKTAPNGLCFTADNKPVYITKRFDIVTGNTKLPLEDFASLSNKTRQNHGLNYKYSGTYHEIANLIKEFSTTHHIDLERFFKLLVFNYIYANGDAHLKNFSLLKQDDDYSLSPAYDLLNTALHVNDGDFALEGNLSSEIEKSDIWERTGHPSKKDFRNFAAHIGLKPDRTERIIQAFSTLPELTVELTGRSFLSAKSQRSYLRIVRERLARFNRQD